jgi:hypothetical protein
MGQGEEEEECYDIETCSICIFSAAPTFRPGVKIILKNFFFFLTDALDKGATTLSKIGLNVTLGILN